MTSGLEDDPIHAPSLPDYPAIEVADGEEVSDVYPRFEIHSGSVADMAELIRDKAAAILDAEVESDIVGSLDQIEAALARMRSIL